ncbi:MAG: hypothetical protein QOG80_1662, partial [Pseudonocardiales bacterium]|nr:hypothetical protein [Pseudonocardiales bacterium]
ELADDKAALAMAYNALQLAYMRSGRVGESSYGRKAMRAYEQLADLAGQGHCANNLAIAAHQDGRWADAEEMFGRAAETFGRIGDVANESNALYNRGDLLVRQGRFAEAEPLLAEVDRTARAVADAELVALALRERARACAGLGDLDAALALFDGARAGFAELGVSHEIPLLEAAQAEGLLRAGRPDEALALLDNALAGPAELLPMVRRLRALTLAGLGRLQDAAAEAEQGLRLDLGGDGGYELAMLLLAQAHVADLASGAASPPPDEAVDILRRLGVDGPADPSGIVRASV